MYKLLLIAIGGAIGSLARDGTGTVLAPVMERTGFFPWGTLAVNLLGCFLIGYVNGLVNDGVIRPEYRFLVVIGFLGGYTTFSSYGWETTAELRDGQFLRACMNVLANNVLGIGLVMVGFALSRLHR